MVMTHTRNSFEGKLTGSLLAICLIAFLFFPSSPLRWSLSGLTSPVVFGMVIGVGHDK